MPPRQTQATSKGLTIMPRLYWPPIVSLAFFFFTVNTVARYSYYIHQFTKQARVSQQNDTGWENTDDYWPYQHGLIKDASELHIIKGVTDNQQSSNLGPIFQRYQRPKSPRLQGKIEKPRKQLTGVLNFNSRLHLPTENTRVQGAYSQRHCVVKTSGILPDNRRLFLNGLVGAKKWCQYMSLPCFPM